MISMIVETKISIKRLQDFLGTDEMDLSYIERINDKKKKNAITIQNGDFIWDDKPNSVDEIIQ